MARPNDRRVFQRLNLPEPLPATFAGAPAEILEIGLGGVLLAHRDAIQVGTMETLTFAGRQGKIEIDAELVRRSQAPFLGRNEEVVTNHSGLRVEKVRPSLEIFRAFLVEQIGNALLAQTPHALQIHMPVKSGMGAGSSSWDSLVAHRLIMGTWESSRTKVVGQPPDGFTLLETSSDVAPVLRAVYEAVDGEGQRLVRMLGELDIGGVNSSASPA